MRLHEADERKERGNTKQQSTGLWLILHKQTMAGRTLKRAVAMSAGGMMTDDIDGDDGLRTMAMPAGSNDDIDGDLMGVMGVMGRER
jgi:hypothetical protein